MKKSNKQLGSKSVSVSGLMSKTDGGICGTAGVKMSPKGDAYNAPHLRASRAQAKKQLS
jgi:hypothetical protein